MFDGSGSQFGGLAAGYNHRLTPRIVIGGEADMSFAAEPAVGAGTYADAAELFGTARGRVGYLSNHWLYYTTGGLAWTRDQFNSAGAPPDGTVETAFAGRFGWTVGGGIEAPVAPGLTARAEYLYSQFGSTSVAFPLGAHVTSDLSLQQLRIGVNDKPDHKPDSKPGDDPQPEDTSRVPAPLEVSPWNLRGQTT